MSCRVLIVEDDDAFAEILGLVLEADGRFKVVGRARDGAEAIALASELSADVLTMDIDMPRTDGVEATAAIRASDPLSRIVVVSGSIFYDRIAEARAAGAAGYVSKSRAVEELADVLVAVCRGGSFVSIA
jgi:DNA-binding NarL/FixJ family response regulator